MVHTDGKTIFPCCRNHGDFSRFRSNENMDGPGTPTPIPRGGRAPPKQCGDNKTQFYPLFCIFVLITQHSPPCRPGNSIHEACNDMTVRYTKDEKLKFKRG